MLLNFNYYTNRFPRGGFAGYAPTRYPGQLLPPHPSLPGYPTHPPAAYDPYPTRPYIPVPVLGANQGGKKHREVRSLLDDDDDRLTLRSQRST